MNQALVTTIDACSFHSFQLEEGSTLRVINTMGSQVIGTWAFAGSDMNEHMSMEHTRIHSSSSRPQIGTVFYTNEHNPILKLSADRSPGVHDWFLAACNQRRYDLLGHEGKHANCTDNFHDAIKELGQSTSFVPCPLNLFENVSLMFSNPMEIKHPIAMPGDYVTLEALCNCVVILSSCPQDILPTNGADATPRNVEVEVIHPKA